MFTIKVVPEYQMWTGAAGNHNWNNDTNWARVSSSDLYRAADKGDRFTTDGVNPLGKANYAPLDFTKVIIPAGTTFPELYENGVEMQDVNGYPWPKNPEASAASSDVTPDIQYDMASLVYTDDKGIGCRPWYLHTCDQINFRPVSEIMHQQWLKYNRAWVEMEIDHSRWYTLASLLKGVVAGDMYLPTAGGRQTTELFKEMNFSYGTYNRFKPAVYQRSWNKATVHELPAASGGEGATRNVAVRTTWSNVFNEVTEAYNNEVGLGYSIKADEVREDTLSFRNSGTEPLVINSIFSDCVCTVPAWSEAPVAPGQLGKIRVKFSI